MNLFRFYKPGFKQRQSQKLKEPGKRYGIMVDCGLNTDPKILMLHKQKDHALLGIYLEILFNIDIETEIWEVREDHFRTWARQIFAEGAPNFQLEKRLLWLSQNGLIGFDVINQTISKPDPNHGQTCFKQPLNMLQTLSKHPDVNPNVTSFRQAETQVLTEHVTPISNQTKNNKNTPIVPKGDDSFFEKFWQAYPKKAGKKPCAGIWSRKKLDRHIDAVMSGLNAYKASEQWRRDNGKYIPNPSTFLNQERWNDEIAVPLQHSLSSETVEDEKARRWKQNREQWFRCRYAIPANRGPLDEIPHKRIGEYQIPSDATAPPWEVVRKDDPTDVLDIREWEPVNSLEDIANAAR